MPIGRRYSRQNEISGLCCWLPKYDRRQVHEEFVPYSV
jgi:hypothetical protein